MVKGDVIRDQVMRLSWQPLRSHPEPLPLRSQISNDTWAPQVWDLLLTMPPIPSPLFTEARTSYEGISRRLKDLGEYQIPRLRDCKGPLTLQQQFAAELRDDTESIAKRLEVSTN